MGFTWVCRKQFLLTRRSQSSQDTYYGSEAAVHQGVESFKDPLSPWRSKGRTSRSVINDVIALAPSDDSLSRPYGYYGCASST